MKQKKNPSKTARHMLSTSLHQALNITTIQLI